MKDLLFNLAANTASFEASMRRAGESVNKLSSQITTIKWGAVTAGLMGVDMALQRVMDWAEIGSMALQAEKSFAMAAAGMGADADALIAKMREASQETIDASELMQKAAKGLVQGLSPETITGLTEAAVVAAKMMGTSVSEAFNKILEAVETLRARGIKSAFIIDTEQALTKLADTLGVTKGELSEFAKQQAMANEILRESQRIGAIVGKELDAQAQAVQMISAAWKEFKEIIGKGVLVVLISFMSVLAKLNAALMALVDGVIVAAKGWTMLGEVLGIPGAEKAVKKIEEIQLALENLRDASLQKGLKLGEAVEEMLGISHKLVAGVKGTLPAGVAGGMLDIEANRKMNQQRQKMEEDFQKKLLELGAQTLEAKLETINIEERAAIAAAENIKAKTSGIRDYFRKLRDEATYAFNLEKSIKPATAEYAEIDKYNEKHIRLLDDITAATFKQENELSEMQGDYEAQLTILNKILAVKIKQVEYDQLIGTYEKAEADQLIKNLEAENNLARLKLRVKAESELGAPTKIPAGSFEKFGYEVPPEMTEILRDRKEELALDAQINALERTYFELQGGALPAMLANNRMLQDIEVDRLERLRGEFPLYEEYYQMQIDLVQEIGKQTRALMATEDIRSTAKEIYSAWMEGIQGVIEGTKNWADVWKGILESMLSAFNRMLDRMVDKWIDSLATMLAESAKSGGGGGIFGGLLKSVIGGIGGLFGGGAGGGGYAWGAATSSYQHGGVVTKPTIAMVGEAGPEAVIPLANETAKKKMLIALGLEEKVKKPESPVSTALIPKFTGIPIGAMQQGGIVTRQSLQMLGEGGPEAVIPLSRFKERQKPESIVPSMRSIREEEGRQGTIVVINANDAKSFDDMVRRNPESILSVSQRSARTRGTMNKIMRR